MVVAEIPLWLVHTGDSGRANGILNHDEDFQGFGDSHDKLENAQNSLSYLQNSGRGKKCAIYSIDINPDGTRIATCGGDGTVRLWCVSSLFSRKRSRFNDEGNYASSEASEESSFSDVDEKGTNKVDNKDAPINGDTEADQETSPENLVRDLTSLVRRKKGGEIHISPSKPAASKNPPSPSRQASAPQSQQQRRLLCTLSAHTGSSVLAVRFSNNGRYLASAGDDAAVCIYTKDSASRGAIGNLTEHSSEHWSRIKLCRGHALDVVGLAWAPDDSHLVSCSLDSETPIIVWKLTDLAANQGHVTHSNVLCNPYKVLGKGVHTSTVKGVTFDPAGTYLASSGDDPAVCIWRAHDDWGLERRIDAGSGIFRRWKEENAQSLSSQTLFRRLSWSTDGAFICSTNCVVKNKHVASTISRDGWSVSTARSAAAGAANLVGHKQPVVVSRHCPKLLGTRDAQKDGNAESESSSGDDDEPSYATLLALGDRHGFVTVWSTRKSRPIFKLQCSETRCTVTDLAWGKVTDDDMLLLVSLLDGNCVALRFRIPDEIGPLLADRDQAKLFKFRYGIDLGDGEFNRGRIFVGDSSGPKFIENALQMSLENRVDEKATKDNEKSNENGGDGGPNGETGEPMQLSINAASVRSLQQESHSKGKKRIRPVLMSVDDDQGPPTKRSETVNGDKGDKTNGEKEKPADPLKHAASLAEKVSTATEGMVRLRREGATGEVVAPEEGVAPTPMQSSLHAERQVSLVLATSVAASSPLAHSTSRIQSVELPVLSSEVSTTTKRDIKHFIASCTNSLRVPLGSKGQSLSCIDLAISHGGSVSWKDQIVGTACSAVAASRNCLAVGTSDGSVQLYGTSPTLGWACGTAFRSHPLLVLGQPIVALQLHNRNGDPNCNDDNKLEMVIVTADGAFGVYGIIPDFRLRYKGSLMPAMLHMSLGTSGQNANEARLPKLSRIQITDSDQLLLLLSQSHGPGHSALDQPAPRSATRQNAGSSFGGAYGSIQAFVYNLPMELWMRISDGRFVLSDFYSTLPSERALSPGDIGVLSRLDDTVRMGALDSSLVPSHRSRANAASTEKSSEIYQHSEEKMNYYATRSHCEDRMACALAVGSSSEFKLWLSRYVRTLSLSGQEDLLRVVVDMLLGTGLRGKNNNNDGKRPSPNVEAHWWLAPSAHVLNLDRKSLIRAVIIPEMSKNRSLQRLTNEISMEMDALDE